MLRLLKTLLRLILLISVVFGLLLAYSRYIEPFRLHVEEVVVSSSNLSEEADGLRVIAFSDIHFGDYYTGTDFQKVLSIIEEEKPDVVVFLGDLIDHFDQYTASYGTEAISSLLAQIDAPGGKFAVFGNHDYGGGAELQYEEILSKGGFQVLKNQRIYLDSYNLAMIGIDDLLIGYGDPTIVAQARAEEFNLILAHEPDVADQILDFPADLILAGHTHGRQVNLKYFDRFILPPYGKNYIRGLYSFDNERDTRLYVTAGIGMTKLPLRFMSPPEVTILTLKKSS